MDPKLRNALLSWISFIPSLVLNPLYHNTVTIEGIICTITIEVIIRMKKIEEINDQAPVNWPILSLNISFFYDLF